MVTTISARPHAWEHRPLQSSSLHLVLPVRPQAGALPPASCQFFGNQFSALLLPNGNFLATGGRDRSGNALRTSENVKNGRWPPERTCRLRVCLNNQAADSSGVWSKLTPGRSHGASLCFSVAQPRYSDLPRLPLGLFGRLCSFPVFMAASSSYRRFSAARAICTVSSKSTTGRAGWTRQRRLNWTLSSPAGGRAGPAVAGAAKRQTNPRTPELRACEEHCRRAPFCKVPVSEKIAVDDLLRRGKDWAIFKRSA